MSETFETARGRKLVSRTSAQDMGTVSDFLLDPDHQSIRALVVGRGRKARLVDWDALTGFGPDAVMIAEEAVVREPADERESLACDGKLALVGKRVLTESGIELGTVDDVLFEPTDGRVLSLRIGEDDLPASALRGLGSYAAVVSAAHDPG